MRAEDGGIGHGSTEDGSINNGGTEDGGIEHGGIKDGSRKGTKTKCKVLSAKCGLVVSRQSLVVGWFRFSEVRSAKCEVRSFC